jgi:hypothetical protein
LKKILVLALVAVFILSCQEPIVVEKVINNNYYITPEPTAINPTNTPTPTKKPHKYHFSHKGCKK